MKAKNIFVLIVFFFSLTFTACSNDPVSTDDSKFDSIATDYSKSEHWLSLPTLKNKEVDVFYLYPTSITTLEKMQPTELINIFKDNCEDL